MGFTLHRPPNVQPYVSDKPVVTQESTNIALQPVITTHASSVSNSVCQQVHDNVGTMNNYMPAPQIINTQFEQAKPPFMYNINSDISNCGQVHFHFMENEQSSTVKIPVFEGILA